MLAKYTSRGNQEHIKINKDSRQSNENIQMLKRIELKS